MIELSKNARKSVIKMINMASSGHPGGSLSCLDILVYLYTNEIRLTEETIQSQKRNKLVLSKGHAVPAIYAIFAELGILKKDELRTFRQIDSRLQGHPNMHEVPGIDMSTGSLGQGISAAVGMALANKYKNNDYKTYVICGDGELQEGQVYEALMFASHYQLKNLIVFIDYNGLQIDGEIENVMNPKPIDEKFSAFGWNVKHIDGHSMKEIEEAVEEAKKSDKPFAIIAHTVKGKGVSFMEHNAAWHGTAPNHQECEQAIKELELCEEETSNG